MFFFFKLTKWRDVHIFQSPGQYMCWWTIYILVISYSPFKRMIFCFWFVTFLIVPTSPSGNSPSSLISSVLGSTFNYLPISSDFFFFFSKFLSLSNYKCLEFPKSSHFIASCLDNHSRLLICYLVFQTTPGVFWQLSLFLILSNIHHARPYHSP